MSKAKLYIVFFILTLFPSSSCMRDFYTLNMRRPRPTNSRYMQDIIAERKIEPAEAPGASSLDYSLSLSSLFGLIFRSPRGLNKIQNSNEG